jgi:hypothetical protein
MNTAHNLATLAHALSTTAKATMYLAIAYTVCTLGRMLAAGVTIL